MITTKFGLAARFTGLKFPIASVLFSQRRIGAGGVSLNTDSEAPGPTTVAARHGQHFSIALGAFLETLGNRQCKSLISCQKRAIENNQERRRARYRDGWEEVDG